MFFLVCKTLAMLVYRNINDQSASFLAIATKDDTQDSDDRHNYNCERDQSYTR